ncbi:unnamed protein product [Brachionus calyciflorus]|uniref:Uncharacterized protein n=1 Tax=Brachionus calyciflorus TaxID=104777 RepID=A0A813XHW1_9BILA|nr:unnamed protein product [Brachionus calyciflorus]
MGSHDHGLIKATDQLEKATIREEIKMEHGINLTPKQLEEEVSRRHKIKILEDKKKKTGAEKTQSNSENTNFRNLQSSPEINKFSSCEPNDSKNSKLFFPTPSLIRFNAICHQKSSVIMVKTINEHNEDPRSSTMSEEMVTDLISDLDPKNSNFLTIRKQELDKTNIQIPPPQQELLDSSRKLLNTNEHFELNCKKEVLYPIKKYGVIIKGPKIQDFSHDIHTRLNELNKCVRIKNPLLIQSVDTPDESYLKILVDNYEDFKKILGHWPANAFKAGFKVTPMSTSLQVSILNVDKTIDMDKKSLLAMDKKIWSSLLGKNIYTREFNT